MEAWLEQNQLSEIQSQIQEWGVEGLDELEFVEGATSPVCQVHCWLAAAALLPGPPPAHCL